MAEQLDKTYQQTNNKQEQTKKQGQFSSCESFPFREITLPKTKPDATTYFNIYRTLKNSRIPINSENMNLALKGLNISLDNKKLEEFLSNQKRLEKTKKKLEILLKSNSENIPYEYQNEDNPEEDNKPQNLNIQITQSPFGKTLLEITGKEEKYKKEIIKSITKDLSKLVNIESAKYNFNKQNSNWGISLSLNLDKRKKTNPLELFTNFVRIYQGFLERKKIIKQMKDNEKYLGVWKKGSSELRNNVSIFLKDLYISLNQELETSRNEIYSNRSYGNISRSRAIISKTLTEKFPKLSLPDIRDILRKKNHTTILQGKRKFTGEIPSDLYQRDTTTIVKYLAQRYIKGEKKKT